MLRFLENQQHNRAFSRVIQRHLENVRRHLEGARASGEVYFSYFRQKENFKWNTEAARKADARPPTFEARLRRKFETLPKNCQHLRSSFFIWRREK